MLRFNEDWLNEEQFQNWLVKVSNDESRAYCRYCAVVLRAHKPDLLTHAGTMKHNKNAVKGANLGPAGPISVQIIPSDDDGNVLPDPSGLATAQYGRNSTPQVKRYRVEWEQIPELKAWITPHPDPSETGKAFCKFCEVQLRAHKHDLMVHAKSIKHQRALEAGLAAMEFQQQQGLDMQEEELITEVENPEAFYTEDDFEDNSSMLSMSMLTPGSSTSKRNGSTLNGKPGIHNDTGNLFHAQQSTNSSNTASRLSARMARKRKLGASDVIDAIESNDFTGYELLQIVKAAIPKL